MKNKHCLILPDEYIYNLYLFMGFLILYDIISFLSYLRLGGLKQNIDVNIKAMINVSKIIPSVTYQV